MKRPPLTLLLGPQTTLSLGLNSVIRTHVYALAEAGYGVLPSRLASPMLRRAVDTRPADERRKEFREALGETPILLSALNFFGAPEEGLMRREMFPHAEVLLARLAGVATDLQLCMSVDTLPAFYLATSSKSLESKVKRTPWEDLYDLSWADLAREIKAALPALDLLVLAPTAARSPDILRLLLGEGLSVLPSEYELLRSQISSTGLAVLDRMQTEEGVDTKVLSELFNSFLLRPSPDDIKTRLGIDAVTQALLEQRFAEDLAAMRKMAGVTVLA